MIYLIGQLAIWLLLTAAFSGLAGWAFAADRSAAAEAHRQRERDNLLRDLIRYAGDGADAPEPEGGEDSSRRMLSIRDARITELEHAVESARWRADALGAELAELQRRGQLNDPDAAELARLRALEAERARTVETEAAPVEDENGALQVWRLRYFEQRVRYLESQARSVPAPASQASEDAPIHEWAAREAQARATFLEDQLRTLQQTADVAATPDAAPFAADADVDMLLRWRMLYLERRVAHLQSEAGSQQSLAALAPEVQEAGPDTDRWKWRARYLEARVRHLEQRAPASAETTPASAEPEAPAPARPAAQTPSRRARPPVLASARNGAPDDLTLIEGVSPLQQTTLYSLGVFHFDQIAGWTDEQVAWIDQYLRLQGRIEEEEWVEQAAELAREGPSAARRAFENEEV
jgi:predicted flap endonuclease-1-like 5' DNA nuclease